MLHVDLFVCARDPIFPLIFGGARCQLWAPKWRKMTELLWSRMMVPI